MIAADIIEGRSVGPINQSRGIRSLEFAQKQWSGMVAYIMGKRNVTRNAVCYGLNRLVQSDQSD